MTGRGRAVAKLKLVRVLSHMARADDTIVLTPEFAEEDGTHRSKRLMEKSGNDGKVSGRL